MAKYADQIDLKPGMTLAWAAQPNVPRYFIVGKDSEGHFVAEQLYGAVRGYCRLSTPLLRTLVEAT